MERLVLIVEQINEARRFIQIDDLAHLRMALLLLDNTSEVLMYRSVVAVLEHDDLWSRIFSSAKEWMPENEFQKFKTESPYKLIPPKTRKAIARFYDAKVDFLVEKGDIQAPVGQVLKSLHRYRNEAYHRDILRKATIRPAVLLFYELVCDLLRTLRPSWMSFSGRDDWSDFCKRYNLDSPDNVMHSGLEKIVEVLRESMTMTPTDLAGILADHLENRVDEMAEMLQFINQNTRGKAEIEDELKRIQFWKEHGRIPLDSNDDESFAKYVPQYSLNHFSKWRQAAVNLSKAGSKLQMFNEFAEIEADLEPLEDMINEVASLVDQAIQMEIDRLRGK